MSVTQHSKHQPQHQSVQGLSSGLRIGAIVGSAIAAIGAVMMVPTIVQAQVATEAEIRSFSMPPSGGVDGTETFTFMGQSFEPLTRMTAYRPSSGVRIPMASKYHYVRFTGIAGRELIMKGDWAYPSAVPINPKYCDRHHLSYGVWVKYRSLDPRTLTYVNYWEFAGGGGLTGVSYGHGSCIFRPLNGRGLSDSQFGWGVNFVRLDFRSRPDYMPQPVEVIVGSLASTELGAPCGATEFGSCYVPSRIFGYTPR